MRARNTTAPVKAYRVEYLGCFAGIYAGRTPGEAKAAAVRNYMGGGAERALWQSLRARRLLNNERATLAIEAYEDAGKYWRDTRAYARLQAQADEFNASWPVGTPVELVGTSMAGLWPQGITVTRTPAWVPNEKSCLVAVEGAAGGFALRQIRPLLEPATL